MTSLFCILNTDVPELAALTSMSRTDLPLAPDGRTLEAVAIAHDVARLAEPSY
jgi:hypothetical protein